VGDFYYKIILINKFIKYNQIDGPCFDIKYIDLYLSLYSSNLFIVNDFFIHLFTQWFLIYLNKCVHKFFDLHLGVFYVKKCIEKFYVFNFLSYIDIFNLILILLFFSFNLSCIVFFHYFFLMFLLFSI